MNLGNTEFLMRSERPNLALKLDKIKMNVTFLYSISTNPDVVNVERGLGHAIYDDLEIFLSLSPVVYKYRPFVDIDDLTVTLGNLDIILKGDDSLKADHIASYIGIFKDEY